MSFSLSGFGHVVIEIADEVDPGLDVATEEARIGAEVYEKGKAIEEQIVSDLTDVVKKHLGHFGGLSFSGQHVGTVDVVAAANGAPESVTTLPPIVNPNGPTDATAQPIDPSQPTQAVDTGPVVEPTSVTSVTDTTGA